MEQTPQNQTNLTQDPKRTKMVAPQPETKVKLRILREVMDPRDKDGIKNGTAPLLMPGQVEEFPVDVAKELVSRKVKGMYDFSGERAETEKTKPIRFAEEFKEPVKSVLDEE